MTDVQSRRRLVFGDLHFHTHYSDNRDRASVAQMVDSGLAVGLGIIGTGDHNHNLDADKWQRTVAETAAVRREHPGLLLINNCEVTFLRGHLLALAPQHIEGTVGEGYRYLTEAGHVTVICHPGVGGDEWDRRILPSATAVEVLNGAVISAARRREQVPRRAIDIPSVAVYARYLALGIEVAAVGNSDAHRIADMGTAMTGFWMPPQPGRGDGSGGGAGYTIADLAATLRQRRTFAATSARYTLSWEAHAADHTLRWAVSELPLSAAGREGAEDGRAVSGAVRIEVYERDRLIDEVHTRLADADSGRQVGGSVAASENGWYWLAVWVGEHLMISSPLAVAGPAGGDGAQHSDGADALVAATARTAAARDTALLQLFTGARRLPTAPSPAAVDTRRVELTVFCAGQDLRLHDNEQRAVPFVAAAFAAGRVVIDKDTDADGFAEFALWLARNELHEYAFARLQWHAGDTRIELDGLLVPRLQTAPEWAECHVGVYEQIVAAMGKRSLPIRLRITVMPTVTLGIDAHRSRFPLSLIDTTSSLSSRLVLLDSPVAPAARPEGDTFPVQLFT